MPRRIVGGLLIAAAIGPWRPALAQAVPAGAADIGTAQTSGGQSLDVTPASGTAADVAPSRAPLSATEPTSIIGKTFIDNNVTPTENYDDIIKFSPSVQNVEPAGVGLQQNFAETIRGFNYTQFNSVFDGIVLPGLPTNFAPLTAAYLTAHDTGSVQIDRGPGTASNIGYATFGGTVSVFSKSPSDTVLINPYTTYGSYGVILGGIELDTGRIDQLNGTRAMIDVSHESGNGAVSGISTTRDNIFTKIEMPVGDNTLVTLVGLVDYEHTNTPYGATLNEILRAGPGYGLDNNPLSQNYKDYNYDKYATDFFYARVKSDLGHGFTVDDTVYTSGYYQHGLKGTDPSDIAANLTRTVYSDGQKISVIDAVPTLHKHNDFRDYGNILRVSKDTDYGQIRSGIMVDDLQASSYRYQELANYGYIPYATSATGKPYSYNYSDSLVTFQPYLEMGVKPLPKSLPGLVITPGVKYTSTTRGLDAAINNSTKLPADFSVTYAKAQPSIDARYTIANGWVAYAQVAKGFLAPPINSLYTASTPPALSPQETTNYQTGMTFQRDWLTVTGDAYYIPFSNLIVPETVAAGTTYVNGGGAIYKGLEAEGTVRVGYGVSFYANYSINDGNYRGNNLPLPLTPRTTAAVGLVYQRDNVGMEGTRLFGSIIGKFVGPQYLQSNISGTPGAPTTISNVYPINAYSFADASIGYTFPVWEQKKVTAKLNVNNIFDNRSLIGLGAVASDGVTPLYFVDPGRSFFVSLSAAL
jgi:iron complex outermembrane receptor protein